MLYRILIIIVLCLQLSSCHSQKAGKAATGYDLAKPYKHWILPETLKEVSGITWVDNNHLLLIEDLHASLYLMNVQQKGQIEKTIPFASRGDKKFDIEDVTIANNTVY